MNWGDVYKAPLIDPNLFTNDFWVLSIPFSPYVPKPVPKPKKRQGIVTRKKEIKIALPIFF